MLNNVLNFLKENVVWIKDILTIVFTLVATIVAVLTYKRAKNTVLQPIRNETIKKQAILLEDLLDFIKTDVDYFELMTLNVVSFLNDYGFVTNKQKEMLKDINDRRIGQRIVTQKEQLDFVEVLTPFSKDLEEEEIKKYKREKFEEAKAGNIDLEMLYISKKFKEYNDKLCSFINNPFLPKRFCTILNEMAKNINYNSSSTLKKILEDFFKEYFENYKNGNANFNMYGIYNTYNHLLISNKKHIHILYEEIREYLFIDYEWK